MKCKFRSQRARRYVVRAAECGQEIIESILIRQVDYRELSAPFIFIAAKEVVLAERDVEKASRSDALWIVIVVLRVGRRHFYQRGSKLRSKTRARESLGNGCMHSVASKPSLKFLVRRQGRT